MKLFYFLVIIFFLNNCSFDDKSGIWKNEINIDENEISTVFKGFNTITTTSEKFSKVIPLNKKFNFNISKPILNQSWTDVYYSKDNNLENFQYSGLNKEVIRTKKISKHKLGEYFLYERGNIILSDNRGNVLVYSINENSIIAKLNFYMKKYKKIDKTLNMIVEKNIIYISDNIGYIYAFNYQIKKVIWAKNFKVPFRSNIKLLSSKILTSNQNNDLLIIDKKTGDLNKSIPSEGTTINNSFSNNLAISDNKIFFLNTYGSLYSINRSDLKFNWFINLNDSIELNATNLFNGSEIVHANNKILLSSNNNFYILNSSNGTIIQKNNFSSNFRPIINNDYIFLITKNNFLVAMKLRNGEIIFSYDINQKIADLVKSKKNNLEIKNFFLINKNIFIFSKNSHLIKFNLDGEIEKLIKLPSKIQSQPIFINNSIFYFDKKNKINILN